MVKIWKSRGLSTVWNFVSCGQLFLQLLPMDVSHGLWPRRIGSELMLLRCGATGGYWEFRGKIREPTNGFWKGLSDMVLQNNILERKLRYFGHVIRKDTSIEKQIIQGAVEGRRGRGRPITSWTDDIKSWNGGSMNVATNLARDREAWRTLIKTTAVPLGSTWPKRESLFCIVMQCGYARLAKSLC